MLAGRNRAQSIAESQHFRAVRRHDLHRLLWGEPSLDEQLVIALIGVAGNGADTARIGAGAEQTAGLHEGALELHPFLHCPAP